LAQKVQAEKKMLKLNAPTRVVREHGGQELRQFGASFGKSPVIIEPVSYRNS
jgi:hypothetical protein